MAPNRKQGPTDTDKVTQCGATNPEWVTQSGATQTGRMTQSGATDMDCVSQAYLGLRESMYWWSGYQYLSNSTFPHVSNRKGQ